MFILRKITPDGNESNTILGNSYKYVGKLENSIDFERILTEVFNKLNEDVIYAFIVNHDASEIYPLYKKQKSYIMTESGKTFSNVSE